MCMNLLPAAAAAWLAAQLTQEFEAKQPSLADQIPGYGDGYGLKPGPNHTGNDKTTNPIPGGSSTVYPADGSKEGVAVGGKPQDPQKPGDNILPDSPADSLPGMGPVFSEGNNSSGNLSLGLHKPIEELISDASKPINSGGLSQAARAWDKHDTSRSGGTFR